MNVRVLIRSLLVVVLLISLLAPLTAAQDQPPGERPKEPDEAHQGGLAPSAAAPGGIQSIGTSTLANVTPAYLPIGAAFDLCFTVFVQSPDEEYMDRFDVDLPDGWTINSIAWNSNPLANGCSGALPPVVGVNADKVMYWQSTGYPPQTGCGAWNGTNAGTNFDFCANVTIPDTSGAPWTFPWNYIGDGYAAEPHQISGAYGPVFPPILLTPEQTEAWGCACEMQEHELVVWNYAGYDTLMDLSYAIVSGEGDCDGPPSLWVPDGADVPFAVDVLPAGAPGDTTVCEVTAEDVSNPANRSTASIVKHLSSEVFDPAGWQLEPVTGATLHYSAGGVVGTHPVAAGEVGYVMGGWASGSAVNPDLQMYDPNTESWMQLADLPNPRHSLVVGWIDGLLYAAGGYGAGYDSSGDLQVYNPGTNIWDNTTPADMPVTRGGGAGGVGFCSAGAGECLFHVGGGLNSWFSSMTLETWQYDPGANAWTQLDDKPAGSSTQGFVLGAGVGCLGQVYVGGDWRGYHEFYRLDATQPAGSQWAQLADIPAAAGVQMPALVCKEDWGALVLIGGDPNGSWGTYNTTVYVYDITTDTWRGPLPQTLNVGQIGAVGWHLDGRVWTTGGAINYIPISPLPFESLAQMPCDPGLCDQWLDVQKSAPATAEYGEVIAYTITLTPNLVADMFMADPLPAGVEYAGNLTWSAGNAWYDGGANTIFWEYEAVAAGTQTAYASQVGPDISRAPEEDGGATVLDNVPAGISGPSTPQGAAWIVRAAPPTDGSRPAGAVDAAGNFYIIGGESSGGWLGQVQRYDPGAGTWDNALATMPTPASNLCAGVIGGDIYIPGGYDGTYYATLQVYHIGSNTWETIASDPLPEGRSGPACAAYDGKLYVFGGSSSGGYTDTAWVYDPAAAIGSRWTTLAPVPQAGAYGAALAVGDLIFYAGMGGSTDLANVYAYDPAANTWTPYPDLTTARGGAGMWAIGDLLLVGGGGWFSYLTSVEQYDTTQGTGGSWTPFEASLVQGRRTFAYATDPAHGRLFAGNGYAGAYLAEAEQLDFELAPEPIQITFDATVTGHCGAVIVNQGTASLGGIEQGFAATTVAGGEAVCIYLPVILRNSP